LKKPGGCLLLHAMCAETVGDRTGGKDGRAAGKHIRPDRAERSSTGSSWPVGSWQNKRVGQW